MDKKQILKFIKDFQNIHITNICEEEHVKTSNLYTLKVSQEKMNNIKNNIDNKIKKLYEVDNETNTL